MAEEGLYRIAGAQEPVPDKFTSLAFIKLIGGLQTQRSPLQSIDNRYNSKFLGGKPDALIAGSNVEISNRLTMQRRPGLVAYGVSNIPSPTNFFDWQLATTADIILVVDTETSGGDNNVGANGGVLRYSPTSSGVYVNKAPLSKQTNFTSVVNTMYFGDGVDLFKVIGPNLLLQSNTFGTGAGTNFSIQSPWTESGIFALTEGQPDPLGTSTAAQIIWSTPGASSFLQQSVLPNYTPVAQNTFTLSLWMKETGGAISVDLEILDQNVAIQNTTFSLTSTWTKYSVTGTMAANSNVVKVRLSTPTTTNTMVIWGAQLEVGGPATTTQITTNLPQGVFLWGIQAPATAPLVVPSSSVVGSPWLPNHAYVSAIYKITSVANASAGSTVYTGVFPNGGSNNLSGSTFTIAGFVGPTNNGVFACTASTTTTITLSNANGVAETNPATAILTLTLTAAQVGGTYIGTILGGGSNGWAGYAITIKGFTNPSNNGTFVCTASTGSSLSLMNNNVIAETATAQALVLGQAVTDSNGNLEVATASGTSGSTTPPWSISPGGTTSDGTQAIFIKQTTQANAGIGKSAVATFGSNVVAGDSLIVFVAANEQAGESITISDNNSNAYTFITSSISGPFTSYMFWVTSAAAGATTVTATIANSQGMFLGVLETSSLASVDAQNSNQAQSIKHGPGVFQTGLVPTATTHDLLVSFAAIIAGNHATSTLATPSSFIPIVSASGVPVSEGQFSVEAAFEFLLMPTTVNPQWAISFAAGGSREMGITVAFVANSTTTLVWTNFGPIGLTAAIGFTYYYAFMNSETGQVSNVSPLSASTGPIAGQSVTISGLGMQTTPSGPYSQDPQVDTIALFRNVDGGGFWFQLATFANPGTATSPGTWTYTDTTPSGQLNTAISAPIGLLNSLPPKGLVDMDYFAGRLFGSSGNFLFYNTAADNAALLNVTQNGVPAESWEPTNFIPFNAPITRILAVGSGLLVCTTLDTWLVEGQNLLNGGFNPRKILANHGLRSYNLAALDGSTIYLYTSDRQCLQISPNSGSVEIGFPIGDTLETSFPSTSGFLVRHVAGSQDNAVFLATTGPEGGWYRLNPNQQGASMSGEQTPLWSPKADFSASIGGIGAIASIETSAGVIQLLVGQAPFTSSGLPTSGPVLVRSLTTFSDFGTPYNWSATFGSILLATPGKLAETDAIIVDMNNVGTGGYSATQCSVSVLLDEIGGTFEPLPSSVNDPPQLPVSQTVLSNRYYLSQGNNTPVCWNMQIKLDGEVLSGLPASTRDEILGVTVRGCLVSEQN